MKHTLAALLVVAAPVAMVPASVAAQTAPAPTPELAAVSAHLKALQTMTASFSQTSQTGQTLTGNLTLARPGKIRFQYQRGVPLLVVSDGRALTMIDYQVRQVSRWPIKNTPLGVLLDPGRDPSRFAQMLPSGDPDRLLVRARDPKHPEYGTITMAFTRMKGAPAGLRLDGWTVLDAQNNQTTVRLSDQRFNVAISPNAFKFTDPRPRRLPGKG